MAKHFREFSGNWEFDLSEKWGHKKRMGECSSGPGDFGKCKSLAGNCGACGFKKKFLGR